jgi:hypothetical protein
MHSLTVIKQAINYPEKKNNPQWDINLQRKYRANNKFMALSTDRKQHGHQNNYCG